MLWSAALLGFASSLHCVGMCGPLQLLVLGAFHKKNTAKHLAIYHAIRILTYGAFGVLATLLGKSLGLQLWQQQTSLLSGLLLLAAFLAFFVLKLDRPLLKILMPILFRFRQKLQAQSGTSNLFFAASGFLNALLPCGMVYMAAFAALGFGNIWFANQYMLVFGLATLPLLLTTHLGLSKILAKSTTLSRKIIPALVVVTALFLILRGMNLGIPMISPSAPATLQEAAVCE